MKSDTFFGDFMVKLIERFSGVVMEKTYLTKLPDNVYINLTIKSS